LDPGAVGKSGDLGAEAVELERIIGAGSLGAIGIFLVSDLAEGRIVEVGDDGSVAGVGAFFAGDFFQEAGRVVFVFHFGVIGIQDREISTESIV